MSVRGSSGATVVLVVLGILAPAAASGCKNVCEKFAEHVEGCHEQFCEEYPGNPICADEGLGESGGDVECPSERRAIYEQLLEHSCKQLARELGWEALNLIQEAR